MSSYNPNKSDDQRSREDIENELIKAEAITPEDIEKRRRSTNPLVEMKGEDNLKNINYTKEEKTPEYPVIKTGEFTGNEDFNNVNKILLGSEQKVKEIQSTENVKPARNFCPNCGYNLQY